MKEILSKISKGATIETLSRDLNMRETTIRAMIVSMVHEGYLEEIECGERTSCSICPVKCEASPTTLQSTTGLRMYRVTKKGLDYMKRGV